MIKYFWIHCSNIKKQSVTPEFSDSDYFEYFCADQILKELDLSDEELQSGIVGDFNNSGIDAIYVLVNGKLVQRLPEANSYPKQNVVVKVVMIQAKTEIGFGEDAINKFVASANDLFDAENDLDDLGATTIEIYWNPLGPFEMFSKTLHHFFLKFNLTINM